MTTSRSAADGHGIGFTSRHQRRLAAKRARYHDKCHTIKHRKNNRNKDYLPALTSPGYDSNSQARLLLKSLLSLDNLPMDFATRMASSLENEAFPQINVAQADGMDYVLTKSTQEFMARDRKLLRQIRTTGARPLFTKKEWSNFSKQWEASLSEEFHCKIRATRVFVPTSSEEPVDAPSPTDLDLVMRRQGTDAIFVHSKSEVLFATLSTKLCDKAAMKSAAKLHQQPQSSLQINQYFEDQISHERSQKRQNRARASLTAANYGCSTRPQKPLSDTKPSVLSTRSLFISAADIPLQQRKSADISSSEFYLGQCLPTFAMHWRGMTKQDRLYNKHSRRRPRISTNARVCHKESFQIPYVVQNSCQPTKRSYVSRIVASYYESSRFRRMAEEYAFLFGALPYGTAAFVAYENELNFHNLFNTESRDNAYSRPAPTGSVGCYHQKPLHDDNNAHTILSTWQSIQTDQNNPVFFRFNLPTQRWHINATTNRFAVFKGMIPHETKLKNEKLKVAHQPRIHHSAYWKPLHEYIALVLMDPDNVHKISMIKK